MKRLLPIICLLLVTACGNQYAMEMKPGHSQGDYKVTQISIDALDAQLRSDPEYQKAKSMLEQTLPQTFTNIGSGKPVTLKILITSVSFEINVLRSILVPDNFRIVAHVELLDANTRMPLNEPKVVSAMSSQNNHGLLGAIIGDAMVDDHEEAHAVVAAFNQRIKNTLYPPKEE